MSKFLDSLAAGHLVFADNYVAKRHHVVTLHRTAFDEDVAKLSKFLSKELRAQRIADINPDRRHKWTATALCGVEGTHSAWGHGFRYYWKPLQNPSLDTVCKGCMREWRKRDEPEIVGWDRTASIEDNWPWPLPFGWRSVPTDSHPWDVPAGEPLDSVKDATGSVVGEHRLERRRWMRGRRIVRLVYHPDSDHYTARHWAIDAAPKDDRYSASGTLQWIRQRCHELMARGGY